MFHTIVSIKNDGHYFCRAGGNRPDGLNEPVTKSLLLFRSLSVPVMK
ncbi:copper resistance protein [Escherichia marmotae]|nr:copper resistance protein [Escherichia marmotae]AUT28103.1 copper resistance protein [Escherichia marmotae]